MTWQHLPSSICSCTSPVGVPTATTCFQSVFMLIDWHDTLSLETRRDGLISREDLGATLPPDGLIVRSARAYKHSDGNPARGSHWCGQATSGTSRHGRWLVGRRLHAAGAQSTVAAGLALDALKRIGLTLGADVPFFLAGRNAWVEGIGEVITPIQLPVGRFLVVKPDQGLETRLIFSAPEPKRDTDSAIISGFAANAFGFGRNDLQPVAQKALPRRDASPSMAAVDWT